MLYLNKTKFSIKEEVNGKVVKETEFYNRFEALEWYNETVVSYLNHPEYGHWFFDEEDEFFNNGSEAFLKTYDGKIWWHIYFITTPFFENVEG